MKEIISTENAPGAIGPYSQAIKAGGMVFCSGQIPIDPATGNFVSDQIAEQTEQVFKNLIAVLDAAGSGLNDVVKTTVFLADMNESNANIYESEIPNGSSLMADAKAPVTVLLPAEQVMVVDGGE